MTGFLQRCAQLFAVGLLAGTLAPAAQRPPRVATHVDSVRFARNATIPYAAALFTLVNGKQVRGYVISPAT